MISSTIILAAGSMFILWLGERITDKGVGNGVSLIIMIGIIARLPEALGQEFVNALSGSQGGGLVKFLFEIIALLFVMALAIVLVKATRKVPVQYAKRVEGRQAARRCTSVHPFEALRSQRHANHLCAGNHVHTFNDCIVNGRC